MRFKVLLFLSLLAGVASAQSVEQKLVEEGRKILTDPAYQQRLKSNDIFGKTLQDYVGTEQGFNDPLAGVHNMMRLEAEDDLRIYTWQMPDSNYHYVKYGLIAVQTPKGIVVTPLKDKSSSMMQPEFAQLKADNWYGAIYYKLIPIKKGRSHLYTLLGYAPGTDLNQKIIEVLAVDRRGRPTFGAKVFKIDQFQDQTFRKPPMRLILRYGGKYAASVRWNEEKEMIVMDHLSPPDAHLKGVYRMYGPDMSYDGLVWGDDWWNLKTEVKFNTGQNIKVVPPDRPVDLPPARPPGGVPPKK